MEFKEKLGQNIKHATQTALLASVVEDENRTIGEILTSLEDDKEAEFLTQVFKDLTISNIVAAYISLKDMKAAIDEDDEDEEEDEDEDEIIDADFEEADEEEEDDEEEDEEDDDDDDEEEDEDEDEEEDGEDVLKKTAEDDDEEEVDEDDDFDDVDIEDEEEEEEEGAKEKGPPRKKAAAPRKKKKGADEEELSLYEPEAKEEYQSRIVKFLRKSSNEKGELAEDLRKSVGGSSAQLRENLAELMKVDRVTKSGAARGTRYHIAD